MNKRKRIREGPSDLIHPSSFRLRIVTVSSRKSLQPNGVSFAVGIVRRRFFQDGDRFRNLPEFESASSEQRPCGEVPIPLAVVLLKKVCQLFNGAVEVAKFEFANRRPVKRVFNRRPN